MSVFESGASKNSIFCARPFSEIVKSSALRSDTYLPFLSLTMTVHVDEVGFDFDYIALVLGFLRRLRVEACEHAEDKNE